MARTPSARVLRGDPLGAAGYRPGGEGELTRTVEPPAINPASPDTAAEPRKLPQPHWGRLRWAGLVLAVTATMLALLWNRFYFGNDDLLQFLVAREHGLSWRTLSLNVFQHFGPYNRLGHLVVYQFTDLAPVAGMALMVVNYVALLVGSLWLMTELGLSTGRRMFALVSIGLSVSVIESALWFDASMHILPAIAISLAICAAHVRGVRTGRRRWHLVALLLFILGQLFQERPIFALPLIVLIDVLLLWRDEPWRERLRRMWRLRAPIGSLIIAAGLIAAALQAFVVEDDATQPSWLTTGRTVLLSLTGYVLPSLVNLPSAEPPGLVVQLVVLTAAVAVGIVFARMRRGNAGPVLFCASVFVIYYGFLKFSAILTPETVELNAERLHNAVYVIVPAIIALAHLRLPRPAMRPRSEMWHSRGAALGVAILVVYCVVTNSAYLTRQWAETTQARAYLDAVRASAGEWSDPDVTVIPLFVNPAMTSSWSKSYGRQDQVLNLIDKGFTIGDLGSRPVIIDSSGSVRPAALIPVAAPADVSSGECAPGRALRPTDIRAELSMPRTRTPSYLVVTYQASRATPFQIVTDPNLRRQLGYSQIVLPAGAHTRVVPLNDSDVRHLVATAAGVVCVDDVEVMRVAQVEPGGTCRYVDRYGRPTTRVLCPDEPR
jgi:hypothetical protein